MRRCVTSTAAAAAAQRLRPGLRRRLSPVCAFSSSSASLTGSARHLADAASSASAAAVADLSSSISSAFKSSSALPASPLPAPFTSPADAAAVPVPRNPTLDSILRVDHAGEYGAQCIYEGQLAALRLRAALSAPSSPLSLLTSVLQPSHTPAHLARSIAVIDEMRLQEVEHLNALSALVPKHRCRPTALLPLWHVAGYALGYGTALMGTRAAMACTVAVEEVITEHYNDQLRVLSSDEWRLEQEAAGQWSEAQQAEMAELRALIRKNRDDEEHHRDVGIEHEAQQTPLYGALTAVISAGCQVAIAVAKRV